MAQLNPYVRFNGNAREAFEFYKSCLGGNVNYTTVGESPMGKDMPDKNKIFHATLTSGPMVLLGSDMVDKEGLTRGNTVVLTLSCTSKEEAGSMYAKLSAGGTIGHPLMDQPWGTIGDFKDKFGVEWFVVFMTDNAKM